MDHTAQHRSPVDCHQLLTHLCLNLHGYTSLEVATQSGSHVHTCVLTVSCGTCTLWLLYLILHPRMLTATPLACLCRSLAEADAVSMFLYDLGDATLLSRQQEGQLSKIYQKGVAQEDAITQLVQDLDRDPTGGELVQHLGVSDSREILQVSHSTSLWNTLCATTLTAIHIIWADCIGAMSLTQAPCSFVLLQSDAIVSGSALNIHVDSHAEGCCSSARPMCTLDMLALGARAYLHTMLSMLAQDASNMSSGCCASAAMQTMA